MTLCPNIIHRQMELVKMRAIGYVYIEGFNMHWQEEYKRKLGTPEEAAALVRSGDRVHTGLLPMPKLIANAISDRRKDLEHLEIFMCGPEHNPGFLDHGWE